MARMIDVGSGRTGSTARARYTRSSETRKRRRRQVISEKLRRLQNKARKAHRAVPKSLTHAKKLQRGKVVTPAE